MENASQFLRKLEETSNDLGNTFHRAGLKGYMASAVFVASDQSPGSVFAITHTGGSPEHFARTDKHVYLRRFDSDNSVAAQVFDENGISMHPSRMFPNEHLCVNIPLTPKGKPDADIHSRGMLQVVFGADSGIDLKGLKSHIKSQPTYQAMSGILIPMLEGVDGGRDSFFKVRDQYEANAVVMFFDISDFSGHSKKLGAYRGQDFADKFCQEYIKPLSEHYGTNLLRYEGDGLWLEMPLDHCKNQSERVKRIQNALDMARTAINNFSNFAIDQDYGFQDAKLKVSMELGEVRNYFWDKHNILQNNADDRSGPIFSNIRMADKNIAHRDRHDIILGPELRATLDDLSIYDISPDAFEHYTP